MGEYPLSTALISAVEPYWSVALTLASQARSAFQHEMNSAYVSRKIMKNEVLCKDSNKPVSQDVHLHTHRYRPRMTEVSRENQGCALVACCIDVGTIA